MIPPQRKWLYRSGTRKKDDRARTASRRRVDHMTETPLHRPWTGSQTETPMSGLSAERPKRGVCRPKQFSAATLKGIRLLRPLCLAHVPTCLPPFRLERCCDNSSRRPVPPLFLARDHSTDLKLDVPWQTTTPCPTQFIDRYLGPAI